MAELCVALDGTDRGWILDMAARVAPEAGWLKVGLEAFVAHGPDLVRDVAALGGRVFLDLKLHDIPTTVARAAANAAAAGAGLITVHAAGGRAMLEAAVAAVSDARPARPPGLVAVTVMTSLDAGALAELGLPAAPRELAARWAALARECGLDGAVASAHEAAALRAACGAGFRIVTPGIRPADAAADDQRRVVTPAEAVAAGADLLVVGRPITRAADPAAAARAVAAEMRSAQNSGRFS